MIDSPGRELHAKAAQARERGEFLQSLDLNDQALFAYDEAKDALGFSEGIGCRSITLRVYAKLHNSKRLLTLAAYEMMAAVALAKESGDREALAMPLFQLAQLQEDLGELSNAVLTYKEAISSMEKNPPPMHNRPSVLADMKIHSGICEYRAGDKSALEKILSQLAILESSKENQFNKDVWTSGAYMGLAKVLKKDDPQKSVEYLGKAKKIIENNPELIVRKQQLQLLETT